MDVFQSFWGISVKLFFVILLFYITIAMLIFGLNALYDEVLVMVITFLTIGTTVLIGCLGWQILVIPAAAIVLGAIARIVSLAKR